MGFTRSGSFPDMPARINNIGIDYAEYDKSAQHRIIVVLTPLEEDSKLGVQTIFLNTANVLKVEGEKQTIRVGITENAFDIDIVGNLVTGGEIGGKAKIWLDMLEKAGYAVSELEGSGDFSALIGLEAEWTQKTYSELTNRKQNTNFTEKPFWIPTKILKSPEKKKSFTQEVLEAADGKSEDELIDWAKKYGKKYSAVFGEVDKAKAENIVQKDEEGKYVVMKNNE